MNSVIDMDAKKRRLAAGVKWGIGLVGAAVIAPVVFLAVQGIVGLILAGLLGLAVVNFAPVVGMKFANWKLRGLKAEARTNPIETMQNQLLAARDRINGQKGALESFMAEVNSFGEDVKRMPADEQADFKARLDTYMQMVTIRQNKLKDAIAQANTFEGAIQRADRRWKMAQRMQGLDKLAGTDADLQMEKMLKEEAMDSVSHSLNKVLAAMDLAFAMEQPALPAPGEPNVVPITLAQQKVAA